MLPEEFILLVPFAALALLISFYFFSGARSHARLASYVAFYIGFYVFLEGFPAIILVALMDAPNWVDRLRPMSWATGLLLSIVFFIVIAFLLPKRAGVTTRKWANLINVYMPSDTLYKTALVLYPLALIGKYSIPSETMELGFMAANRAASDSIDVSGMPFLGPFAALFYPLSAYLIFVFRSGEKGGKFRRLQTAVIFSLCAFTVGYHMLVKGGRGEIISLMFPLLLVYWLMGERRKVLFSLGSVGLILVFLTPFVYEYRNDSRNYIGQDMSSRLGNFSTIFDFSDFDAKSFFSSFRKVVFRFDGVPHGGNLALYTLEDLNRFVYFNPYLGALVGVIPRQLWPSKPTPGSGNGLSSDTPQWKSGFISNRPGLATSVSVPGILFWHFGIFGVFLGALVTAGFLKVMIYLGDTLGRNDVVLLLLFVINPIRGPDVILLNIFQWIIPIVILLSCIRTLRRGRPALGSRM
ncbi:MAG: hypothetical protein ABJ056_14090 [Halioglobus sp.]